MMRVPRDLEVTLPSPSEMDNFHRCPCLWYLKDRMWIQSKKERWPLLFGRIVDDVCGIWLMKGMTEIENLIEVYWQKVQEIEPVYEDDYFTAYAASTKDALEAWVKKYGKLVQEEEIVAIQPKLKMDVNVKLDYVVKTATGLRVRERKLLTGWADFEDEVAKYELGFQPLCYQEMAEKYFKEPIECVELEFLIRSVPASGRFKEKPADAQRREIFIGAWKKDMWYNSALYTNECMKLLEGSLDAEEKNVSFASIPRHTRNCLVKLGKKTYPCDFYVCCKSNMNPLMVPDYFTCDREEATDALKRHSEGSEIRTEFERALCPTLGG